MTQLATEIQRFRDWAETYPHRHGEWECDYTQWNALWSAAIKLIESCSSGHIASSEASDLLYVLARDNETEHLCNEIASHHNLLRTLAKCAVGCDEPDAKWQLAVAIGESRLEDAADLLRPYLYDPDEYVRRRSLMAFALFAPTEAEQIAVRDLGNDYEYTRMAALNVLHLLQSSHLPDALTRLGDDPNMYVRAYVNELLSSKTGG